MGLGLFKTAVVLLTLNFIISSTAWAASVSKVKGNRVLINLDGAATSPNDEYFLLNPAGKKVAIIRIRQVKNDKAVADVVKGRASVGLSLQAKGSSRMSAPVSNEAPGGETQSYESSSAAGYSKVMKDSWGVLGTFIMNTMNADITYKDLFNNTQSTSASMSGSSFGVGGFYDRAFSPAIVGRAAALLEEFDASGNASAAACSGSTNCTAKITYLSLYGLGKYYFMTDKYRMWAGGGFGYLLALSKSSSALNESAISANQVAVLAVGGDIQMSRENYIPISLEYNYYWPSPDVTASQILIKAGWAWNL